LNAGDRLASGDPADQWVRDPVTGEYRLRLPGDPLPAPVPQAQPRPQPQPASDGEPARESRAQGARRAAPAPADGRAARRRSARGGRSRSGLWLAAAVGFALVLVGGGAYALLRPSGGTAVTSTRATGAAPSPTACRSAAAAAATAAPASAGPTGLAALPSGPKAAPINVRVTVYNGSGTFGQAEKVLDWMQNTEGFLRTSNGGPAGATAHTTLVYAPNHIDQARTLAAAMGLPASALKGTGKGTGLRDPMVLTLGQDFQGVGKPLAAPSSGASGSQGACATR
jgi:hypothetical protein